MKFLLLLCLILSVVAGIQMQTISQDAAVYYSVTNTAASTTGGIRFSTDVGDDDTVIALMDSVTNFIWTVFQQTEPADKKDFQQVPLFVEKMPEGGAFGTEDGINYYYAAYCIINEIHFSADYIEGFLGDFKTEFTGVLYHEMTHVWQWDGNNENAPAGLTEGIADYIRLKSGYESIYWSGSGQGDKWDQGYDVTAYFLEYCSNQYKTIMKDVFTADFLEYGFVAELNRMMKDDYSDNYFYDLLGKSVEELWDDYKSDADIPEDNNNMGCCVIS